MQQMPIIKLLTAQVTDVPGRESTFVTKKWLKYAGKVVT